MLFYFKLSEHNKHNKLTKKYCMEACNCQHRASGQQSKDKQIKNIKYIDNINVEQQQQKMYVKEMYQYHFM